MPHCCLIDPRTSIGACTKGNTSDKTYVLASSPPNVPPERSDLELFIFVAVTFSTLSSIKEQSNVKSSENIFNFFKICFLMGFSRKSVGLFEAYGVVWRGLEHLDTEHDMNRD